MRLDGADDYLQGAYTNGGALSQQFSVFAVAQLAVAAVNDGNYRFMFDGDDTTNRANIYQNPIPSPDQWTMLAGANLFDGNTDSNWNIWSTLFNGASLQFWQNGVSVAAGAIGAQKPDGLTIGAMANATAQWMGNITSIVICDPSLSDAQRVAMQNSMNAYWSCY